MAADPNYDPAEFQAVLHDWLDRTGMSQMSAAHTIGVSQGIVNRWLKPRSDSYLVQPDVSSLEKLAPHIHIPLLELKRMCGRLSPSELGMKITRPRRDMRLEAFINDIEAKWPDLDEPERQHGLDIGRVGFKLHERRRKPRGRADGTPPPDDPARPKVLTAA